MSETPMIDDSTKQLNSKKSLIRKGISTLFSQGIMVFLYKTYNKIKNKYNYKNEYYKWIKFNEADALSKEDLSYNPMISVIVPVYNVNDKQLIECIESVTNQTYDNWQLCLVDDASTWESVRDVLRKYENNSKIDVVYRKENGHISIATNDGIKIAKGDFIGFLDCDDLLSPNALYEVAKKLNEDSEYDFIYSDEDKLTEDGKQRHSPFFKPDWSPDTLMSLMYTCHFSVYRKSIVDEIGGLRSEFNGSQDYDFVLRFTEKSKKVGHVDKILYHWRERKESTASTPEAKPYALEAMRKCKEEALKRRGLNGTVEYLKDAYQFRVNYINTDKPLVSIIIPSKDNYPILKRCILSLKKYTSYENYEVVIVDNGSNDENKDKYIKLCEENNCLYHYEKMDFNFSKMCNIGAEISKGEVYLFLNDDIEVLKEDWLERMVGHATLNHVGAVGAKLLYPDSTIIQHSGVTNLKLGPSHTLVGMDDKGIYYYGRNKIDYNFIAVTGACLMIEKAKFYKVNAFDETLPVAYNDVDLCFKLVESGYFNVLRNDVILYHHESVSRGMDNLCEKKMKRLVRERKLLFSKHKHFDGEDPFYSRNLTQYKADYDINYESYPDNFIEENKEIKSKWKSKPAKACIDSIALGDNIRIEGWAFMPGIRINNLNSKRIVLLDKNNNMVFSTKNVIREDVNNSINGHGNLSLSGFTCTIKRDLLKSKEYKIGMLLENKLLFRKSFVIADKKLTIH